MKAIRFQGVGGPDVIQVIDEPMPEPRPDDLLIRVQAAGVNRADILQREGLYGAHPDYGDSPIPGLEVAGTVVAIGARAAGFKPGDRVMAVVGGGGYAQYARVDHRMAMPVPEALTAVQAAAIPEVFVTAHEALLHLGEAAPGDWVLIHAAAGGVGSATVALAHALGAQIVYTASGDERVRRVAALGGTVGVDYKKEDFLDTVLRATHGRGVAVVVDFIGAPYLERNLRSLAAGGRLIQVGLLGGSTGVLPMGLLLHQHLRLIGTVMKSRPWAEKLAMTTRFRQRWLAAFTAGTLAPIVDRVFPFECAADAHRAMEAAGGFGRIILAME